MSEGTKWQEVWTKSVAIVNGAWTAVTFQDPDTGADITPNYLEMFMSAGDTVFIVNDNTAPTWAPGVGTARRAVVAGATAALVKTAPVGLVNPRRLYWMRCVTNANLTLTINYGHIKDRD